MLPFCGDANFSSFIDPREPAAEPFLEKVDFVDALKGIFLSDFPFIFKSSFFLESLNSPGVNKVDVSSYEVYFSNLVNIE